MKLLEVERGEVKIIK